MFHTIHGFSSHPFRPGRQRMLIFLLAVIFCCATNPLVWSSTWDNGGNDLQWGTVNNWDPDVVPGASQTACFTNLGLSSGNTITLGGDRSVHDLLFDLTTSFTIGGDSGNLTLATGNLTRTASSSGIQTIARPVVLSASGVWNVLAGSGELKLTNTITGAGSETFNVYSAAALSFSGGTYGMGGATFSNTGTINFNGASVSFDASTSIPGTVNFSSATLSGTNTLTFAGPLTWSAGTMSGSGTTMAQGGILFNGNSDTYLDGRTLTNASTDPLKPATFSANNYLHGKNGAIFNNETDATVVLNGINHFVNDNVGAAPTFHNDGTLTKTSGSLINFGFVMNNTATGTVDVQNGTLNINAGGTNSGNGKFKVSSVTATLAFPTSTATYNLNGAEFDNSGTIKLNGGTISFIGGTNTMSGTGSFNFSSGTLNGSGTGTISCPLTWTAGTMSGSGTTLAQGGILFSGYGNTYLDGRTLTNTGTATFSDSNYLYGRNGAIFNNQLGALLDLQGSNRLANDVGAATLNNAGIFRKSASTGTVDVYFGMNNTGEVQVQNGTLALRGAVTQLPVPGTTLTGGTWIVNTNSTLNLVLGNNITTNQGNVTLDGLLSNFTKINFLTTNQGSFSVLGGRNFTTAGNLANSGTLTVGSGSAFTVSGNLTGAGNTIVNGTMTANYISQNSLTLGAGALVTIQAIPGGPLGIETISPVPEPGTLIMLLIALAAVAAYKVVGN